MVHSRSSNGRVREWADERSANKVFVNGEQKFEHKLKDGDPRHDRRQHDSIRAAERRNAPPILSFDDKPLGHTRWLMSAKGRSDNGSAAVRSRYQRWHGCSLAVDKVVLESLQRQSKYPQ